MVTIYTINIDKATVEKEEREHDYFLNQDEYGRELRRPIHFLTELDAWTELLKRLRSNYLFESKMVEKHREVLARFEARLPVTTDNLKLAIERARVYSDTIKTNIQTQGE